MLRFARPEAFVASFHLLDDFVRRQLVTLLLGEVRVGQHASPRFKGELGQAAVGGLRPST